MTRKHFEALAHALFMTMPGIMQDAPREAQLAHAAALKQWRSDVRRVADTLAGTNPRFDRQRFYAAAGHDDATD